MISDQHPTTQGEENLSTSSINPKNTRSTSTHTSDVTPKTIQVEQKPASNQNKTNMQPVKEQMNPSLTRLLIGGLIGATVGAIAGALTNRKTSQGLNHAAQGVNRASKTIGEGLSHAASGVVDATKSVGEGMNYAISESTHDAVQGIAEGTQQIKTAAADVAQNTTNQMSRAAKGVTESVQQTKNATLQAMQATTDRVNRAAQGTTEIVKTSAKQAGESVQEAIAAPQTDQAISAQTDFGTELMNTLQESSIMTGDDDSLDAELINALNEVQDSAGSTTFFIPKEGMMQEEILDGDSDVTPEEYLFADVEVNSPGEKE
jgi:gas vesicle protein